MLVIPASCWTIIAGIWPVNAFGVTVHLTPFASAAAEASGIKAALRLRGHDDTQVVVWGGDGSTCDIGFSGVSAAAERNEDIVYVLNDNEAYMNTGVQKSGATPEGAWTTTTPTTAPRAGQKKDIARDHGGARDPVRRDARRGIRADAEGLPGEGGEGRRGARLPLPARPRRRARPAGGTRPRSPRRSRGWPSSRTTFPLWECDHGAWRITYRPKHPLPVSEFLGAQGRFSHLSPEEIETIQSHVDERWNQLAALESPPRN